MGFKDLEVYVSARDPHVMLAEPTSPPALVLGSAVVAADPAAVWFGAGAALLAVHAGLGIPGRMSRDELAVLGWSVLRALDPELPIGEGDEAVVDAHAQKLRRQIPAALADEARAHASTLRTFDHNALARDIQIARLRAGFVASGSLTAGLALLAAAVGSDVPGVLAQPAVEALIAFAIV
jgi:hypothetical protein